MTPRSNKSFEDPFRILVFSKTSDYRHDCISAAVSALESLGARSGLFTVDASEDAEACITPRSLAAYRTIVFLHCTGPFLNANQIGALRGYVQSGGGFVGVHAAAAGLLEDDWYGRLIGAHFDHHPPPEEAACVVEDPGHFVMRRGLDPGKTLTGAADVTRKRWTDEWYNFRSHPRENKNLHILIRGDPSTFEGGAMGDDHPLAWCQEFDGGRSFYSALGHFEKSYEDEWFMDTIYNAIVWTARREDDVRPKSPSSSVR
ncbi:glycosyl hydrolase [Colletotrichum graminicola]|uniref:Glycosyl hydrolase n=1 Tax=Colletotrichum graminicola (strain M1.001 / M2 / FGSC 10212) TaxID=645133 RepID=E3Q520_COLGM|nr:glycosyl hydrolase [Colletotrichum graminicola M1.001]EFQ25787.1 glycosyl hydrolase [Colletotrichum graminicola M1.001]WDK22890.1 glycosyl hydrolase [Colletotrichum graminicola]